MYIIRNKPDINTFIARIDNCLTEKDFELYNEIDKEEYIKVKECFENNINYYTKRAINPNGKTYKKIKYQIQYNDFIIRKFKNDKNTNKEEYLKKVEDIKKDNLQIQKDMIDVIDKWNKLKDYNDYVEYRGIKYGIII
tara:strand:- start:198 stop:611 length:414 start_codon:yes stop_codon:yes gene_type:complete